MINAPAAGSVPTASLILGKAKRHGAIRRTRGERVFAVVNIVVLCLAVATVLLRGRRADAPVSADPSGSTEHSSSDRS